MKENTFIELAKLLNEHKIRWAVGASYMLYLYGVVDNYNDFDLIVHHDDIDLLQNCMCASSAQQLECTPKKGYDSLYFTKWIFKGIEIDLIADFRVVRDDKIYTLPFDESKMKIKNLQSVQINLMDLQDWRVMYYAMNRQAKVDSIDDFLKQQ